MKFKILAPAATLLGLLLLSLSHFAQTTIAPKHAIRLKDPELDEVSGLVYSQDQPGYLWLHNDSGDSGRVFLVDLQGNTKKSFHWHERVKDCEDIAIGPGDKSGKDYLYVGDIGDNGATRPAIFVYRFPEPSLNDSSQLRNIQKLTLKYPDGSRDAETLMVDPLGKELYIVSKREDTVGIYSTPLPMAEGYSETDTITLKKAGSLFVRGMRPFKWITAGDISRDGHQILLRSYQKVYYWRREDGETIESAMSRPPQLLPHHRELQGEAIGFSEDGNSYTTISEGRSAPIFTFHLKDAGVAR